ncbi:MAG: D-aminoacylase [Chloroflexota bacterium]
MAFDLLIRTGTVYDGTGGPGRRADVGIRDDRIAEVGDLAQATAARELDATGLAVTPGFIDTHTHSDMACFLGAEHVALKAATVRQGVTTEVCGNCGSTPFPMLEERRGELARSKAIFAAVEGPWHNLAEYRDAVRAHGLHANLAPLLGHGSLRAGVMGMDDRPPRDEELKSMIRLAEEAFEQGAFGISSGLIYAPGVYARTEELVAICRAVARHRRPYTTHMRNESDLVADSMREAMRIGGEGGVPVHISHHKVAGRRNWGRTTETLEMVRAARAAGSDVSLDVYPYTAGSTMLAATLPPWALDGGFDAMRDRLRDRAVRERVVRDMESGLPGWENLSELAGWAGIAISSCPSHPDYEGRRVVELAEMAGRSPADLVFDLLVEDAQRTLMILHVMDDGDVRNVLGFEAAMVGSDGIPVPGKPHPRWAGTFPRVLGHYRRDVGLLDLAGWVRKATGLAADRFGLADRGYVEAGKIADLAVFDAATIADRATYEDPLLPPVGVHEVIVNGRAVVSGGELTGALPGRVLEAG